MEYRGSHMLRTLYKDSGFILAAVDNNGFEIGGIRHEFDGDKLDLSRFDQEKQTANLKKMERIIHPVSKTKERGRMHHEGEERNGKV